MKQNNKWLAICLSIYTLFSVGCPSGGVRSGSNMQPQVNDGKQPRPADADPQAVLARIVGVTLENTSLPANMPDERTIVVDIKNEGNLDATFDTYCEWKCPSGSNTTGGKRQVDATNLSAGEQRRIVRETRMFCSPMPKELDFTCEISQDTKTINQWSGSVSVPF